ncbi:TBC1 domain family member 31 [Larimichthys crocea]|uniref:Uncharacterized protein n=2 Tax=Larimichthys crocea TaxID=215358 RepID=A0ACD3QUU5_LARCR|nr:TBC1 domain family member 31 [Larimichthys crocea]
MSTRAQLQEQQLSSADKDTQRQMRIRSPCSTRGLPLPTAVSVGTNAVGPAVRPNSTTSPKQARTSMVCLNSNSPSESTSTNFSLDRGRAQLDSSERELLKEIRELRQKLATRAREGSSASSQSVHTLSSVS